MESSIICCTLRYWYYEICIRSMDSVPAIGIQLCIKMPFRQFSTQNICHHAWKTTLQCIFILQLQEVDPIHDLLRSIGEQQYIALYFWQLSLHGDIYFVSGKVVGMVLWCIVVFWSQGDCNRKYTNFLVPWSEKTTYIQGLQQKVER